MTERWVKATQSGSPVWINMAFAQWIEPAGKNEQGLKTIVYFKAVGDGGAIMWFPQPPEHFLPKTAAIFALVDALREIERLRQFGDHGSTAIAQAALDQWEAANKWR